jgi:hypothetical protein
LVSIGLSPFCIYKKDTSFSSFRQVLFSDTQWNAQRLALLALRRTGASRPSGKGSGVENCLEWRQSPQRPVHLGMMAGDHFPRENVCRLNRGYAKSCGFSRKRRFFGNFWVTF